ncbi:hypothetical protein HMPREF1979_00418 [Actinomyces johnsonii F0542]|uniref:Uncharacterized protein n=1 Tax=Actinomyces johnsonii F0542 TaxID=1321818 RepID=U1S0V3_9ACTO|nr:hypothetical protein HMPREF1979_00418 [Actinomyces johnsonii F0542]
MTVAIHPLPRASQRPCRDSGRRSACLTASGRAGRLGTTGRGSL